MIKKKQLLTKELYYKFSKSEINNTKLKFLLFFISNICHSTNILNNSTSKIHNLTVLNKMYFYQQYKNSKTVISRNCILTGRSRANYRRVGISRCMLKDLISKGTLPGYKKAIW